MPPLDRKTVREARMFAAVNVASASYLLVTGETVAVRAVAAVAFLTGLMFCIVAWYALEAPDAS